MQRFPSFLFSSMFLFLASCSGDLKEIRLQTVTGHAFLLPATSDTSQVMETNSVLWVSQWDSVRQAAGIPQGDIQEAIPLAAEAFLVSPDSTLNSLRRFDFYTQDAQGAATLLASIPEGDRPSGTSQSLFASSQNHLGNFMRESPELLLRYRVGEPRDTVWTVELQVLWEMRGEWD